jgi:uncharacterized protein (TIGR03435 family)
MWSERRITLMTKSRVAVCVGACVLAWPAVLLVAQQTTSTEKFEVASVRENTNDDGKVMLGIQPGGRFNAHNVPLWDLIRQAYAVQRTQIVGAPDWTETARYDIVAKASDEIPRSGPDMPLGPLNFMLQDLLADRFRLKAHRETRDLPMYALTFARSDQRLGEGLKVSSVDCAAMARSGGGARGRGGPPPGFGPGQRPTCGMRLAPGRIIAGGATIAQLTQMLSQLAQRIVVDKTGLSGAYDIDLTFTPDRMPQGAPPPGVPMPNIDPNGPSLFTALQEQLGLKLDSQRAPTDVLVIDHVERPTPD